MNGWAQAATIIGAVIAVGGVQAFWIARALDAQTRAVDALADRLLHVERAVGHISERIARVETP